MADSTETMNETVDIKMAEVSFSALEPVIGRGGLSLLYLAAQMDTAPIQQSLLQWVFEQSGIATDLELALSLCSESRLASSDDKGIWQFDCEAASQLVLSLDKGEQDNALKLKDIAVQYLLLAVEGQIDASLITSDLGHIRYLSAHPMTENQCDLLIWLADFSYQNGDVSTAADCWQGIYQYIKEWEGPESENALTAMNNLAESLRQLGDLAEAREIYERQIEIAKNTSGADAPLTLTAMINLAGVCRDEGLYIKAKALELTVVKSRARLLGEDHPETLAAMNNLASTLKSMGEAEEAIALQTSVLQQAKSLYPVTHPLVTEAAWNLAQTLLSQNDYDALQDIIFDDLFWLMDDHAEIQTQNQEMVKSMLQQLLSQAS